MMASAWLASMGAVANSHSQSYSTLSPVSTGMGHRLRVGISPCQHVTKPTRSTQPCIPPGSLNQVSAFIGWGKGGNVTFVGWQVTLNWMAQTSGYFTTLL